MGPVKGCEAVPGRTQWNILKFNQTSDWESKEFNLCLLSSQVEHFPSQKTDSTRSGDWKDSYVEKISASIETMQYLQNTRSQPCLFSLSYFAIPKVVCTNHLIC